MCNVIHRVEYEHYHNQYSSAQLSNQLNQLWRTTKVHNFNKNKLGIIRARLKIVLGHRRLSSVNERNESRLEKKPRPIRFKTFAQIAVILKLVLIADSHSQN